MKIITDYNISDENEKLCMAFYGTGFKHWKNTTDLDIFEVKSNISLLLDKMGFNSIEYKISKYKNSDLALDILIKKSKVGIIFSPTTRVEINSADMVDMDNHLKTVKL